MSKPIIPAPLQRRRDYWNLIAIRLGAVLQCAVGTSICFQRVHASPPDDKALYPPTLSGGAPCGSCTAPDNLSWKTVIPPDKEAGEPLVISGKVFQPDGKTPAEGMVLWGCHTDASNSPRDPGLVWPPGLPGKGS